MTRILVCIVLAASGAACGGKASPPAAPSPEPSAVETPPPETPATPASSSPDKPCDDECQACMEECTTGADPSYDCEADCM